MFRCASTDLTAYECKYKTYTCVYCKKFGHLQSNCFVKKKKNENSKKQNNVNLSDDNDKVEYTLYNVSSRSAPCKTNIIIDGKPVSMAIDSGAAVTIMSKDVFYDHYHFSIVTMVKQSENILSTYTGDKMQYMALLTYVFPQKGNQLNFLLP